MHREHEFYYSNHTQDFIDRTYSIDLSDQYQNLILHLPSPEHHKVTILDLGCGSGRDTLAFIKKGYHVVATDQCVELLDYLRREAHRTLNSEQLSRLSIVHHDMTQPWPLAWVGNFDGIWAMASLVHFSSSQIPSILKKMNQSLRSHGFAFMTLKASNQDDYEAIDSNQRFFHYWTIDHLKQKFQEAKVDATISLSESTKGDSQIWIHSKWNYQNSLLKDSVPHRASSVIF